MTASEAVLLDANVLIALSFVDHVHRERAATWLRGVPRFATTPITQGSLARFAVRVATPQHAKDLLTLLSENERHEFWADDVELSADTLRGVTSHAQVADAYLAGLAAARSTRLATFDGGLRRLRPDVVDVVP